MNSNCAHFTQKLPSIRTVCRRSSVWGFSINFAIRVQYNQRQRFRCHAQTLTPLLMARSTRQTDWLLLFVSILKSLGPKNWNLKLLPLITQPVRSIAGHQNSPLHLGTGRKGVNLRRESHIWNTTIKSVIVCLGDSLCDRSNVKSICEFCFPISSCQGRNKKTLAKNKNRNRIKKYAEKMKFSLQVFFQSKLLFLWSEKME